MGVSHTYKRSTSRATAPANIFLQRAALLAILGDAARPAPGATQLGQRARGVVSLHLRTLAREGRMTVTIGRRELLAALGSAAAAWPLAARAQQPAMPVIGFLHGASPEGVRAHGDPFRQGFQIQ